MSLRVKSSKAALASASSGSAASSGQTSGVFQLQSRFQHEVDQLRQELEKEQRRSSQQLQGRLGELEASCKDLTEKKYKNEAAVRDLKGKLVASEEVGVQVEQLQALSCREEGGIKHRLYASALRRAKIICQSFLYGSQSDGWIPPVRVLHEHVQITLLLEHEGELSSLI